MREPKLYFAESMYELKSIAYSSLPEPDENISEVNMRITDSTKVIDFSNETIAIEIERKLDLEPRSFFTLSVVVKLTNTLDQDRSFKFKSDQDRKRYIEDNIKTIVDGSKIMQEVCLLVGNITSSYGRIPSMIPPELLVEE